MKWILNFIETLAERLGYQAITYGPRLNRRPPDTPPQAPTVPVAPVITPKPPPMNPDDIMYPWDTPGHIYHNFRVECDKAGLSVDEKNMLCACIYQESQFLNSAKCENKGPDGTVWSTDWGICQVNDHYHIGQNKDFPSVQFVLEYPDKVSLWMIHMYKIGLLKQWVSYSSGAFRHWLSPTSPMWNLANQV